MEDLYNISLIPRDQIFGNPDRISAQISPNGANLSFLAPVNGVLNVWVGPTGNLEMAKPVTNDTFRGIRAYGWTYNNDHLIYIQDKNGDENWRIYVVNLSSGDIKDLTPFEGVQARIQTISSKFPEEVVIALNKRNPQYHDIYKLNIKTGNLTLLTENDQFISFDVDDDLKVRLASKMIPDGGLEFFRALKGGWEHWFEVGKEDSLTTGTLGFN
ncbi:MAG: S9 family peptidase, partial [Methanotrichaceae archaeon]|nr:S9 family peptidase [Methanotrichaceae archaeon]